MFARLLSSSGATDYVTGQCIFADTTGGLIEPQIWEFTFSLLDATIIGVEFEGIYTRPINPPLITTRDAVISIQLKGNDMPVLVDQDIKQILRTSAENLPLIMNDLKTWSGKRLFEEKLKGTINTEALP